MPTARKLPSGSWRCQVFSHYDVITAIDGTEKKKRIYKSFTCNDSSKAGKKKCELMAAEWATLQKKDKQEQLILSEACNRYIESKRNVLSPSTIRGYTQIKNQYLSNLMNRNIYQITQEDIQKAINKEAATISPKTTRNIHGFISAVFALYRPEFRLQTTLPAKKRPDLHIPTDKEVKKLINIVKGTNMELPILLAAFGPLRRSEICGLQVEDFKENTAHIQRAIVSNEKGEWIEKSTKTYAGDRFIDFPKAVIDLLPESGNVTTLTPTSITHKFAKILKQNKLPHFRFHDLRHYSASIQHAMGIPDAYIMQRGGWQSDSVLKEIYRHALNDKQIEMSNKINNYFDDNF